MPETRVKLTTNNRPIGRVLLACMVLGFASLIAAGFAAAWLTGQNQEHTRWVNHTYEVELAIAQASIAIEQGETPRRGYLITRAPAYLETYRANRARQPEILARVSRLTADTIGMIMMANTMPAINRLLPYWFTVIGASVANSGIQLK